jgi:hypothetical protein
MQAIACTPGSRQDPARPGSSLVENPERLISFGARILLMRIVFGLGLWLALAVSVSGQVDADGVVLRLMRAGSQSKEAPTVWRRVQVDPQLDLVVAIDAPLEGEGTFFWWSGERTLGLFVQERMPPWRAFKVAATHGTNDCAARLLRVSATDTVISCRGEMSAVYANQKFVYDIRAKALVKRFAYEPFTDFRVRRRLPGGLEFVGRRYTSQQEVVVAYSPGATPSWRVLALRAWREASADLPPVDGSPYQFASPALGPRRAFRLAARTEPSDLRKDCADQEVVLVETSADAQHTVHVAPSEACETIGPWQVEADKLWFARAFYGGEGNTGIGGFGYFDFATRRFELFRPPELADWSTPALLVQPDAVWLALAHNGEWGRSSGGVLRFDRKAQRYSRFDLSGAIGAAFAPAGNSMLLATDGGVSVISGTSAVNYFVDQTTDGRLRVVESSR